MLLYSYCFHYTLISRETQLTQMAPEQSLNNSSRGLQWYDILAEPEVSTAWNQKIYLFSVSKTMH